MGFALRLIDAVLICALALGVEALFGYSGRLFRLVGHPVTWIGTALDRLDRRLNRETDTPIRRRVCGALVLATVLVIVGLISLTIARLTWALVPAPAAVLILGLLASTCLAQRSLDRHVRDVAHALEREGLDPARRAVGRIVGRDTAGLDEAAVARAAIESLAENFADGVVAPAFWLAVLGLPGGLVYKAVNTADSMIGHRTPRHAAFGFAAAKLDDAANWVPARLAAFWLIAAAALAPGASASAAWRVMLRDARGHPSPNAGWPEAAMAGALGVRLGGPRAYAGTMVADAFIGAAKRPADAAAIRAALRLYRIACGLQIVVVIALALLIAQWS